MASAAQGSTRTVSWHSRSATALPCGAAPLFAANDIGEAPYRAIHDAARRLWRDHHIDATFVAASRAQSAFWQGRMDACRWWNSVGRMLDRALVAGGSRLHPIANPQAAPTICQAPVNS